MKRQLKTHIRANISVDKMPFGFISGVATTDVIFPMRQLQEKYLTKRRNLCLAFVDLEKAFDLVPRKIIWCPMRIAGKTEYVISHW